MFDLAKEKLGKDEGGRMLDIRDDIMDRYKIKLLDYVPLYSGLCTLSTPFDIQKKMGLHEEIVESKGLSIISEIT